MAVPVNRRRQVSRHGLEPRNYDAITVGNPCVDKRRSDYDPRHRDNGYLGVPLPDPNRKAPWGV